MKYKVSGILFLVGLFLFGCTAENKKLYDAKAVQELDSLTFTIGELTSFSFTLATLESTGENGEEGKVYTENDVYVKGPTKMYYYTKGANARKSYFYSNGQLAVLHLDENKYDVIDAPATIVETIDSLNSEFKIDFPAADFFYPTLTDDLINHSDSIFLLENKTIDGVVCKQVYASNSRLNIFIFIEEATQLPKQLEIYYLKPEKKGNSYIATFSNWKTNPELEDKMFSFAPTESLEKAELFK